jgi:hypothetical protein
MKFQISIDYHKKAIRLSIEQLYIDDRLERYQVTGGNGLIVLESNRPLFRSKGIKHRPGTWQQTEGRILSPRVIGLIAKAIEKRVENN